MTTTNDGQLKKTVKHSAIYAIGTMLRRLTGFIMLPIYTRYLTPADYGVVELLTIAIEITGILIGLRISQAMFRYYILAGSDKEKNLIVSTVLITVILSSCAGTGVLFFAAEPLANIIFGNTDYVLEFRLFAFTLLTNAITAVGLSYLRARQEPVLFVSINIASLILQVCLNVLFVVMLEMHVTGVIYSALISGSLITLGLSIFLLLKSGLQYSHSIAIELIKFVAPLILASIGAFYVAYADKYFIRLFSGLNDVGLYALAARISSVLGTVYEAFNMSWSADRFEIVKKENAREIFEQVFRFISAVIIIVGTGLALFANDFFRIMASPDFYPAGNIVPILILAGIPSLYKMYCNFGALYSSQTGVMAVASWLNAVTASIGYLLLIPYIGVYGAAIALVVSNFVELAWVHRKSKHYYDMGLQWFPVYMMLITAVFFVVIGQVIPVGDMEYLSLRVVLFGVLLALIYKMPFWMPEDRQLMIAVYTKFSRLRKIWGKI